MLSVSRPLVAALVLLLSAPARGWQSGSLSALRSPIAHSTSSECSSRSTCRAAREPRAVMALAEGDAFDMSELTRRIASLREDVVVQPLPLSQLVVQPPDFPQPLPLSQLSNEDAGLSHCYVLLFNEGSNNEGIYSVASDDINVVLAWETEADAMNYGEKLVAQNMPQPTPKLFPMSDINEFVSEAGLHVGVVRDGMDYTPPSRTVDKFDWAPSGPASGEPPTRETDGTYSEDQLDAFKRQFERGL
ncbi:hypothetical protein T492DRAFT_931434 [Pavlovales sp. CCMP2436]|nr:hypothetical protein T492DRAFT_931434 [Pavlovales sp. CCMP2436]